MIQLNNIEFTVSGREVLKSVSLHLPDGSRAALTGPNGAGKTTLLRVITGELQEYKGSVSIPADFRIGYLPQEERSVGAGEILHTVISGNRQAADLEIRIHRINQALNGTGPGPEQDKLLKQLGSLEEQYRAGGGYDLEHLARAVLSGLGFRESEFHQPVGSLSGGWRMRLYLARILVNDPDVLLLDEPTNHLDLPSLEWLEQYLQNYRGTLLIVSHDRYFLDRTAKEIIEVRGGALTRYRGNFSAFEQQKEERFQQLVKQAEAQRQEKEKIEKWVEKFRYKATKAAQVQSRIKQLEKMETIEVPGRERGFDFRLETGETSYKHVFSARDVYFRYESDWVLKEVNLDIYRGDRIALVGPNGAGKTTLTRLITGGITPQQGSTVLGRRVRFGYFAQHQIDCLDPDMDLVAHVMNAGGYSEKQVRGILGVFGFSGEASEKKIGVLSGGEKARVTLAGILADPANFLLMDEPTNHLDMDAKKALEKALSRYDGTLLLISHDRYFLDQLVTRVVEVQDGHLEDYEGNYSEYLRKKESITLAEKETCSGTASAQDAPPRSRDLKRMAAGIRQAASSERRRLGILVKEQEETIAAHERELEEMEMRLARQDTYSNPDYAAELKKNYSVRRRELDALYEIWTEHQTALEQLLAKMEEDISSLSTTE